MKHHEVNETSIVIMLAICCSSLISLVVGLLAVKFSGKIQQKINQIATPYSPSVVCKRSPTVFSNNKEPKTPPTPLVGQIAAP